MEKQTKTQKMRKQWKAEWWKMFIINILIDINVIFMKYINKNKKYIKSIEKSKNCFNY